MADKKQKPGRKYVDYGIDQRTFVVVWETSPDLDAAAARLAEIARQTGKPPMPGPIIVARAAGYRKAGVELKKMKKGRTDTLDVAALNQLISDIRAGKPVNVPPVPAPPKRGRGKA